MTEETCGTCKHFLPCPKHLGSGICRRYPPTVFVDPRYMHIQQVFLLSSWPDVETDMSCGEYKEDFDKIEDIDDE